MDTKDLIRNLEFEYHSIAAANPNWETSLWDFLVSREFTADQIWEHCPEAAREAGQEEPDWL